MVYGYYIGEKFFVEGCNYCQMSTGGQHAGNCPVRDIKVADKPGWNPDYYKDSGYKVVVTED